ncbi:ABC transporter substrate-binding protein [Cohnella sp. CIP 111063]|uniref:extracellular solute-binding protein n=1 Tax=unclassified Cohnella TaxID=2636738 RepID=UPI000B8C5394|nr:MULTISPECIES: extracellular solute-binding protein [unclassified Cohnella]OXS57669.1 ABC transporter substrate-binding protein [Cohnella sp. CIP 111063]PRX71060.1 carbohydrate ABC transporter substrate-binding protein (CUT1 family) [Cohnella sp. SGD-V74]
MRKSRAAFALGLALASVPALAACSGDGGKETAGPETGASAGTAPSETASAAPEKEEAAKITIMLPLNIAETPPDTVEKEIERLTNTELTYQFFPADTYEEKLNASFATGSLPQVTYLKNQATFLIMKDAIREGQFWEIGPYLGEFANLSKLKPAILDNTKVDGKLYSLYVGRPLARQGMIYRKDWADKLGLKAPETVDELFEMAKRFTEDDPDGNGKPDTIGLADRNDLIYGAFKTIASWFATPNNWGEKDGKLLPEFMFPEYEATMDFMKKLRDGGYMNQDFAATSKTDQTNLFTSGKAGIYIGSMQDVNSLQKDLVKNVPDAVVDTHALIKGPSGQATTWSIPGYNNVVLFPKSAIKDEAELKKVLAFFDKLMTSEVATTMFWGVEGVHYEKVDGKAKELDDKERIEREVKGFKDSLIGEPETNGQLEAYHTLEARIHAEELIVENEKIAIHDPTAALDSPTYTSEGLQLQELIKDATYKYMYGNIDNAGFQAMVDDWAKRGGSKIIEEFNAARAK